MTTVRASQPPAAVALASRTRTSGEVATGGSSSSVGVHLSDGCDKCDHAPRTPCWFDLPLSRGRRDSIVSHEVAHPQFCDRLSEALAAYRGNPRTTLMRCRFSEQRKQSATAVDQVHRAEGVSRPPIHGFPDLHPHLAPVHERIAAVRSIPSTSVAGRMHATSLGN